MEYVDGSTVAETTPRNFDSNLQNLVNEIYDWTIRNNMNCIERN